MEEIGEGGGKEEEKEEEEEHLMIFILIGLRMSGLCGYDYYFAFATFGICGFGLVVIFLGVVLLGVSVQKGLLVLCKCIHV